MPSASPLAFRALCVSFAVISGIAAQETRPSNLPTIPPPDASAAEVPAGYRVEVAVSGLMYPSSIELDGAGAIYVAECGHMPGDDTKPARVLKLSGKERTVVADAFEAPITDLLWHDGKLFVSHRGKISVIENGAVRDIVTGLPSLGDHSNNQMAVGPDGKIYFGQGSATNSGVVGPDNFAFGWPEKNPEVCETTARDIVLVGQEFESPDPRDPSGVKKAKTSAYQPFGKVVPAGTVIKGTVKANCSVLCVNGDGSGLEVHAWGFRNPYGLAWAGDKLYVADAGSDERGSRKIANAPEKLYLVKKDAWYGWPDFEGAIPVTDPRIKPPKDAGPQFLMKEHPAVEKPVLVFETHSSVTQMDVSRSPAFGFEGQLFVGASGDQSPVTASTPVRAGYWVRRIDTGSSKAETFFRTRPDALGPKGVEYVATAGPKRIVDVRFSPEGDALWVVDIGPIHYVDGPKGPKPVAFPGTGVIWRITKAP